MVAWALVPKAALKVTGELREYASSEHGRRSFCPQCGTSLFYANATIFPNEIDVQVATLDDPESMAPQIQVQVADRIGWTTRLHEVPEFERYPVGP